MCRNERRVPGVGGTASVALLEKDESNPGVRIVRFAGFRRAVFIGRFTGEGGAERWHELVSTTEAVEMAGREG